MKKGFAWIAAVICLLALTGCGKYVSSYKAVGFVHSNTSKSAFMNFYSFDGKMVFQLKSSGEGELQYSASLESGSATIYYDYNDVKTELCTIEAGNAVDSHGGYVEAGTVYIIVETDGKCENGEFTFSVE